MREHQGIFGKIFSVTFMNFTFKYVNSVFGKKKNQCLL